MGLAAGQAACQAMGAEHVCDYEEIKLAEANGELVALPPGFSFWLHRTTAVTVGDVTYEPGSGARCVDWQLSTDNNADGEYADVEVLGQPIYHFDDDPVFDTQPEHAQPGEIQCSAIRSIFCCTSPP